MSNQTKYYRILDTQNLGNKTTLNQMIAMDLFYLENKSLLLDLKIMLMTGAAMLGNSLSRGRRHDAVGRAKCTNLEGIGAKSGRVGNLPTTL